MIVVVSGLPRSGTSLMMQMLRAGGMELLTDDRRAADPDNPRGYCEFEPVKRLRDDASWLAQAEGKAVKIVSALVFDLPAGHRYKVILMTRDLAEILASQRDMLERRGAADTGPDDAIMRSHLERHLAKVRRFLKGTEYIECLECSYNDLVREPRAVVGQVAAFLGNGVAEDGMLQAVDPSLHRHRRPAGGTTALAGR